MPSSSGGEEGDSLVIWIMKGYIEVNVFLNIPSDNGGQTLQDAVAAIIERSEDLHLRDRRWSLAELQLDNDDYTWLCNWALNLSGRTAKLWLEERPWFTLHVGQRECTYSTALGILLLLFAEENARRRATEGNLWSNFQEGHFHKSTYHILYTAGQPTRIHKDALERGARWLNLRHVFGEEGLQNWFDTVYLQFGFTNRGFHRRLPEWLIGQGRTQAIQHLLDGPMHSESFRILWHALRDFRRKNLRTEQLKSRLANNPWILPEWIEDLLAQAAARIEIGAGAETDILDRRDEIISFLTDPILRWNSPDTPQFVSYVTNIAQFELTEPTYYLMINGRVCTQLQRSDDGIYSFYPSDEIELPTTLPILVTTLISSGGQVIASYPISLWDTNDDITVFRATGKRMNAWQDTMRTETSYYLITAPDISIEPPPPYWCKLDAQGTRLSLLQEGWSSSLTARLEGHLFWQPNNKELSKREEPRWAHLVDISLESDTNQISFGDKLQVLIRHPEHISLSFVRLCTKPISFSDQSEEIAITEPIVITPEMLFHGSHLAELNFTLGARKDAASIRIDRSLRVEVIGAAMLSSEGWIALQPEMTLTVEQARTNPIQVFQAGLKEWAILEGDTWIGRPSGTPRPIGSLAGLGAQIRLRHGPYNAIDRDAPLMNEVVNRGIITSIQPRREHDYSTYNIQLAYPIELSDQHKVVVWDENGQLHVADREYMLVQLRQTADWILELPDNAARPIVIAIAYSGRRLGAWWENNWTDLLQHQSQDNKTKATMLRWFQLPILNDSSCLLVRGFVEQYGSTILPIWLSDVPLLDHLDWSIADEQWLSAVRILFSRWRPNDWATRRLVGQLGGMDEHLEEPMLQTAWKLLRIDPLLMGKVLQRFVTDVYYPQFGISATRELFKMLLSMLTEATDSNNLFQRKSTLMGEISDTMGYVDLNFVRRGLLEPALSIFNRKAIPSIQENNLALALSIEPFRRLLGINILERIEQSIFIRR